MPWEKVTASSSTPTKSVARDSKTAKAYAIQDLMRERDWAVGSGWKQLPHVLEQDEMPERRLVFISKPPILSPEGNRVPLQRDREGRVQEGNYPREPEGLRRRAGGDIQG